MTSAKDYLFQNGITNEPQKDLYVRRGDQEWSMSAHMEAYAEQMAKEAVQEYKESFDPKE